MRTVKRLSKSPILFFIFIFSFFYSCRLELEPPALIRGFSSPSSAQEVVRFSQKAASRSDVLSVETFGESENGWPLVAVRAASSTSGEEEKLRVLIFAQQHGNEQSGKEAALLLISDIAKGYHGSWLEGLELWIVPQVNPDGSDVNERRNAAGIDLNRDHIVQQASETRALHRLFRKVMPHVTVDIHEYQPFRESWREFGGYKNFDVQVGVPTNPNVDQNIRDFALNNVLPAIESHLNDKGFSFHNYIVGPAPNRGRTRHSTVDFDDGRQSFAILGTMSFIYEGINGPDGFVENLERRTYGQYEALLALNNFLLENATLIKQITENARQNLKNLLPGQSVAIRMEHFPDGNALVLPLTSSNTGADTLVIVENYHPQVKPLLKSEAPKAYLVPKTDSLLMSFIALHNIVTIDEMAFDDHYVKRWKIKTIHISEDEELENRFPEVDKEDITQKIIPEEYIYVPVGQLHSHFLVSLFEPQSMLGLAQRNGFEYLLREGEFFPILRLE